MATETEIMETVIEPMGAMFGRPYGCRTEREVDMAQAEYLKTLRDIPIKALEAGWSEVRSTWDKRTWPPVATIVKASREHTPHRPPPQRRDMKLKPFEARQLLNTTPEGDLAYRMRIPASFVAFAIREGRIPSENELREIASCRFTAEELPEICSKVESGSMRRKLEELGRDILERNERMCREREESL